MVAFTLIELLIVVVILGILAWHRRLRPPEFGEQHLEGVLRLGLQVGMAVEGYKAEMGSSPSRRGGSVPVTDSDPTSSAVQTGGTQTGTNAAAAAELLVQGAPRRHRDGGP